MKATAAFLILGAAVLMPFASADSPGFDAYTTHSAAGGLNSNVQQNWYVVYPSQAPVGSLVHLGITVDSTLPASAAYTLTLESTMLQGCTASALSTSASMFSGITGRIDLTLTAEDCHGTMLFALSSSTAVARARVRVSVMAEDLKVDLADDATADGALTVDVADDTLADGSLTSYACSADALGADPRSCDYRLSFPATENTIGMDRMTMLVFFLVFLVFAVFYMESKVVAGWCLPGIILALVPSFGFNLALGVILLAAGVITELFTKPVEDQEAKQGPVI